MIGKKINTLAQMLLVKPLMEMFHDKGMVTTQVKPCPKIASCADSMNLATGLAFLAWLHPPICLNLTCLGRILPFYFFPAFFPYGNGMVDIVVGVLWFFF